MKQWLMKNSFLKGIITFAFLSIIIIGASIFLIYEQHWIGPAYLLIGFIGISTLKLFGIKLEDVYPDITFGIVDNGVLIFAATLGGYFAGITGAILGGAAGNTITDGLGGLFEGRMSERLKRNNLEIEKNAISTMLGKMIGCLIGAGIGLIIIWGIQITGRIISTTNILG